VFECFLVLVLLLCALDCVLQFNLLLQSLWSSNFYARVLLCTPARSDSFRM